MTAGTPPTARTDRRTAAALGFGYLALSSLTLSLTRFDGGVPFIWVAGSLLLARLVVLDVARWPWPIAACATASAISSALFGLGPRAAPFIATANMIEAAAAALLIRRARGGPHYLDSVAGISRFILAAALVAPPLTGIIGATTATLVTGLSWEINLLHWCAGHGLGAMIVTPLFSLAMTERIGSRLGRMGRGRAADTAVLLAVVAACAAFVFSQSRPLLFLPFLPMMLMTIRGGRMGAVGSTLLLAVIGGAMTLRGLGPMTLLHDEIGGRILFLEAYIACAALLVLPTAALLRERGALLRRAVLDERKYRVLMAHSADAIVDVTYEGTIRYASPAIASVTGRDPASLVDQPFRTLVLDEDVPRLVAVAQAAAARKDLAYSVQFRSAAAAAEPAWIEARIRAISDVSAAEAGVVISLRDVSAHKAAERALAAEAATDALTGLANRRAFLAVLQRRFGEMAARDVCASVAMLDLDHFKQVNDRFGHAAGDAVLQAVAAAAKRALREGDCIGRLGGEEFAVLFWDVGPQAAVAAATRVADAIRALAIALPDGATLRVTTSIGVAHLDPAGDPAAVLAAADAALYRAKHAGRNRLRAA